jgi:SAM-dependent methyltransferase
VDHGDVNVSSRLYDRIGRSYATTRQTDPRIAALIDEALGDARSVVNVGAGTGSYEPVDRDVVAVEPSAAMIAQRPPGAAPAVQASAEHLPFPDSSFDAALAVNTVHHWTDLRAGLRELRRVARRRIVFFLCDPRRGVPFWLVEDYLPVLRRRERIGALVETIADELRPLTVVPLRLPRDCADGLFTAYWARPELYLDETVRRNISHFAVGTEDELREGLARLAADLASGAWDERYGHLRAFPELDLGHRVLVAELT